MTKSLKLTIIGAGSSYTPEIIEGIIKRHNSLPFSEIWLLDIEEGKEKLDIVGNLAKRMVEKSKIPCKIYLTLDLEQALSGAHFVTTQFRVGRLPARALDERIPLSHGLLGQETNGAGGFMKAQRTIPVILDICKKMEKICPDAWLINFTNPASMVTNSILNYTSIRCIGVCNVPILYEKLIMKHLNCQQDDFVMQMSGINHYSWVKHVWYKGKDVVMDMVDPFLNDEVANPKNVHSETFKESQIRNLNMLPSPYHRYYYLTDEMLKQEIEDYKKNGTRAEVVIEIEKELFELYKDPNLKDKPKQLEERGGAFYSEVACNVMDSIYNNTNQRMVVNIMNKGTIDFLPYNSTIETTCIVGSCGALPLSVDSFSASAKAELILMNTWENLAVQSAITGDIETAIEAFNLNPLITSGEVAKTVLDELIKAHIHYLPQYQDYYNKYLK